MTVATSLAALLAEEIWLPEAVRCASIMAEECLAGRIGSLSAYVRMYVCMHACGGSLQAPRDAFDL